MHVLTQLTSFEGASNWGTHSEVAQLCHKSNERDSGFNPLSPTFVHKILNPMRVNDHMVLTIKTRQYTILCAHSIGFQMQKNLKYKNTKSVCVGGGSSFT